MAKTGWTGMSKRGATRRLEQALGVAFDAGAASELGGSAGSMALVGEDAWVALQLERRHGHPVENVLQYWPWLERNRRRLVLVHVLLPDARRRTGPRADLTTWAGSMMERVLPARFTYCRVELGTPGEPEQLAAAAEAIEAARAPREARPLLHGA